MPVLTSPRSALLRAAPVLVALAWLAGACADPDEVGDAPLDDGFEVETEVSELIPTVITVRWAGHDLAVDEAYVDFGKDTDYAFRAPAILGEDGRLEAMLLGMPPSTEVHYRVADLADGEPVTGVDRVVDTGAAPQGLHGTGVEVMDEDRVHEGFIVTSFVSNPGWVVILDTDGQVVWWYQEVDVETEGRAISRVRMSRDRRSVVFLSNTPLGAEDDDIEGSHLTRISLDGTDIERIAATECHNDFVELPGGGYAVLQEDLRVVDGNDVWGDRLLELLPDGTEREIWTVWDHVAYDPDEVAYGRWSHANALDHDEEEGVYYVGARHLSTIFKIDRASAELLWSFGGTHGDFQPTEMGLVFNEYQHQFQLLDDGILIFDNRKEPLPGSRVVEYGIDFDEMETHLVWEYATDPPLFCPGLGDVTRFDDGTTLIIWSAGGQIDQVGPDGELLYQLNLHLGSALGYGVWMDDLYGGS